MNQRVALLSCADYTPDRVYQVVCQAFDHLELSQRFKRGDRILLKPNLLMPAAPQHAATTHPAVVAAVARALKDCGAKLSLGDSPAVHGIRRVLYKSRIDRILDQCDIQLLPFERRREVHFEQGKVLKHFPLAAVLQEHDMIINLPKLKTHSLTYFTGAIKNLFGCIPGFFKSKLHLHIPDSHLFAQALVDLYSYIKPSVNLMDGIVGMQGAGPANGRPCQIGVIIASTDAVALDAVALQVVKQEPLAVPMLQLAVEQGSGQIEDLTILGNRIADCQVADFDFPRRGLDILQQYLPAPLARWLRLNLTARPHVQRAKCLACRSCLQVCPAQAIGMSRHKYAVIDLEKCIRCFCCSEVCPQEADAIRIEQGSLLKLGHKLVESFTRSWS